MVPQPLEGQSNIDGLGLWYLRNLSNTRFGRQEFIGYLLYR